MSFEHDRDCLELAWGVYLREKVVRKTDVISHEGDTVVGTTLQDVNIFD